MSKKILLIEDDEMISSMYKISLERSGYNTYVCVDWLLIESALSMFEPDVILLDIMIGRMNGIETYKVIKKYYEWIWDGTVPRTIVFTNLDNEWLKKEFSQLWVNEYLLKSDTEPSDLLNFLNTWKILKRPIFA